VPHVKEGPEATPVLQKRLKHFFNLFTDVSHVRATCQRRSRRDTADTRRSKASEVVVVKRVKW
jgi:hypothetical protein